MHLDHLALNVSEPQSVANWYVESVGMKVLRRGKSPSNFFSVTDSGRDAAVEFYLDHDHQILDLAEISHMSLHLAFMGDDIDCMKRKLIAGGATMVEDISKTPSGDLVLMLRDPWGLPIQLVQRVQPMLEASGVRIEHFASNVADSRAKAAWFNENLGTRVLRAGGGPTYGMFIVDSGNHMMLELYQNSDYPVLDFSKVSHNSLHLGWRVADLAGTSKSLMKAGASLVKDVFETRGGDQALLMRDPWGFPVQFIKRGAQSS